MKIPPLAVVLAIFAAIPALFVSYFLVGDPIATALELGGDRGSLTALAIAIVIAAAAGGVGVWIGSRGGRSR